MEPTGVIREAAIGRPSAYHGRARYRMGRDCDRGTQHLPAKQPLGMSGREHRQINSPEAMARNRRVRRRASRSQHSANTASPGRPTNKIGAAQWPSSGVMITSGWAATTLIGSASGGGPTKSERLNGSPPL